MSIVDELKDKRMAEIKKRETNSEMYEEMGSTMNIKKTLMSCMDMKKFIEETKNIIDNSEHFNFKSDRTRKYIDEKDPKFIISSELLNKHSKVKNDDIEKMNKIMDEIRPYVVSELINKFSDYVAECIIDEDKFNNLFKNLPEEFSSTFLTRIYTLRISPSENTIVLGYFL
jgi:hypothetical protein